MAIQNIILAIDEYIGQLREARRLLVSSSHPLNLQKRTKKMTVTNKSRASVNKESSVSSISPAPVAIRVIPPVVPRERRLRKRTTPPASPVFAKFTARGPVIVRPSEIGQSGLAANQQRSLKNTVKHEGAINHLDELAREVRQRMAANIR